MIAKYEIYDGVNDKWISETIDTEMYLENADDEEWTEKNLYEYLCDATEGGEKNVRNFQIV